MKLGKKIEFHPDARVRLVDAVSDGLNKVIVSHGKYLDDTSRFVSFYEADRVVPTTGKLRDALVAYVEEFPIVGFVSDVLSRELFELDQYQSDKPTLRLAEVEGYSDVRALAKRLVDEIETLPWIYVLTVKLPPALSEVFSLFKDGFAFSQSIWIKPPSDEFTNKYPINSSIERKQRRIHSGPGLFGFLQPEEKKWDDACTYLQIVANGYISRFGSSLPAETVGRSIRSFLGLGLALRLLDIQRDYSPFPARAEVIVHKLVGEKLEIDTKYNLSDQDSRALSGVKLDNLDGQLITLEDRTRWSLEKFKEMKYVYDAAERSDTVLLACQWLFDSYAGQDQLLNYVQAMTVLEILFGEEGRSEVSLGELMRNRCAYLIGKSHEDRAAILRDFKEIYRVRSQILHRGKHRLDLNEFGLFRNLRWMCKRAIQEEVSLIVSDMKKREALKTSTVG